ncbi:MAG: ATP-binding protein [Candidatus Odinarchaeota archaeon]|nr:ATP-binding protein [Candidatus Odinarchaeota archaeon]
MSAKEIVIISAKGGVGKTTLTSSLAIALSKKIKLVVADTDVDAPNLGIVLGFKKTAEHPIQASEKAFINWDRCTHCGKCVEVCKEGALTMVNEKLRFTYELCEGCGVCALVCPEKAIDIKRVNSGVIAVGTTEYDIPCVIGQLNIGESASGQLVTTAKRLAQMEAWKHKAELILIDGPPGSSCPTISSVTGSSYVILVTEPTPAALSDLKRAQGVAAHFKVPHGIVINKADLVEGFKAEVYAYAKEMGIKILGEIPVDNNVPYAIANGKPIIVQNPESPASKEISKIADRLVEIIKHIKPPIPS